MIKNFLIIILLLFSCTSKKEEVHLGKFDILKIVTKADPKASLIRPATINDGVKCKDYGEGCKSGHMASVVGLETIFVEFDNEQNALKTALRIDGLYLHNWVFDDAKNEPILRKFFMGKLKAKDARAEYEKNPKILKQDD